MLLSLDRRFRDVFLSLSVWEARNGHLPEFVVERTGCPVVFVLLDEPCRIGIV